VVITQRGRSHATVTRASPMRSWETWPAALGEPFDAADEDVGTKAPPIDADLGDRAVRGDRQRQHVEAIEAVRGDQLGVVTRGSADRGARLGRVPCVAVDQRLSIGPE